MKKKTAILYICICSMLLQGGCSMRYNYREVADLQIIQTLGIDTLDSGVELSISSGLTENGKSTVLSRPGLNIASAMGSLQDYSAKQYLMFSHVQYVIVGEDAAKGGIAGYLDYVGRAADMRMDLSMFVTKGGTSKELITACGTKDYDITQVMASMKQDLDFRGDGHVFSCRDISRSLSQCGAALINAVQQTDTQGSVLAEDAESTAVPCGYGILKEGALVGYLTRHEASAASLILGKPGLGRIFVEDDDGEVTGVELSGGKAEIKPVWNYDGSLAKIEFRLSFKGGINESSASDKFSDKEFLQLIEEKINRRIGETAAGVVRTSQLLKADFLNLRGHVRKSDPAKFDALDWESAFPATEISVSVKTEIERSFDLTDPLGSFDKLADKEGGNEK